MSRHSIKDDQWHILNREYYTGSRTVETFKEYIYKDNKLQEIEVTYPPALVKIINEIIDNSVDILMNTKNAKIKIDITDKKVKVQDNGNGIPIQTIKDLDGSEILIPKACWGKAKAGSNFNHDEDDATTNGVNGVGSYCTNVMSKSFIGITRDGKKEFKGEWSNNSLDYKETIKDTKSKGTIVEFEPDLSLYDIDEITNDIILVIKQRLVNLNITFTNIIFTLNKEVIKANKKDIIKSMTNKEFNIIETDKYSIAVLQNEDDDFKCFTVMNGLNMKSGTHIDYVLKNVINSIREKLPKKYDNKIKYGDIKNKLQIVFIGKEFPFMKFESQTKETLKNPDRDISNYLDTDWKTILPQVMKNKSLIKNITEYADVKAEFEARKALKDLAKPKKEDDLLMDNYYPATKEKKYLIISEGTSARASQQKALGNFEYGYFELRGVPANVLEISHAKFKANKRGMPELYEIIKNEDYDYILLGSDADADGCLRGDSKIKLPNGQTKTMEKLSKLYPIGGDSFDVWSYDDLNNKPVIGKAHSVRITKKVKKMHKITFENDTCIYATDNHPFLTLDGIYKRSDELEIDDSIESVYFDINSDGYETISNRNIKKQPTHRYIASTLYEDIKGFDIHHINLNKIDNSPKNLQKLTRSEHSKLHNILNSNFKKYNGSQKHKDDLKKAKESGRYDNTSNFIEYNKTVDNSINTSQRNKKMWKDDNYRNHMKEKKKEYMDNGGREQCSENAKTYNHKVKRIEIIDTYEDVYDMTVDKYNNFGVEVKENELIYVHNSHINGLLIAFMLKYFPEKLKENKVGFLKMPLIVVRDKKDNLIETLYSIDEYKTFISKNKDITKYNFDYKKGYGSLNGPQEMSEFLDKDGLEKIIDIIEWEDSNEDFINNWLLSDQEYLNKRKEMILNNEFDINKVI